MPDLVTLGVVALVVIAFCYRSSLLRLLYVSLAPSQLKLWVDGVLTENRADVFAKWTVEQTVARLTSELSGTIAERFEAERQNFHPALRAEIAALRKERDELKDGWIDIPVCVWGVRAHERDAFSYAALVQYSQKHKKLRAHPDPRKRELWRIGGGSGHPLERESEYFPLGAPWHHKVEGDPKKVVILGQIYSL